MSARGVGVPRITIESSFYFFSHAQHGGSADFHGSALFEEKLGYGGAAYLGGSLYRRFRVVLVPSVGRIEELWGLGKHLFHLIEVSVASYDEFSNSL